MGQKAIKAIDTMDALARAKALRAAHLKNLVDVIVVPGVRYALSDARRAMNLVYGGQKCPRC